MQLEVDAAKRDIDAVDTNSFQLLGQIFAVVDHVRCAERLDPLLGFGTRRSRHHVLKAADELGDLNHSRTDATSAANNQNRLSFAIRAV